MRNLLPAGRAATAGLVVLLTLVAVRTPVAASNADPVLTRSDNVVLLWDEATLQAVRDTRPAGPAATAASTSRPAIWTGAGWAAASAPTPAPRPAATSPARPHPDDLGPIAVARPDGY